MAKFKDLTIRKKIIITTFVLILLIAGVKVYEYFFIEKLESSVVSNLDKNWKSLQYSKDLEAYFYLSTTAYANYAITSDDNWLKLAEETEKQFDESLKNIKANTQYAEDFNKTINNIETRTGKYYKEVHEIIKQNPSRLNAYLKEQNNDIMQTIYYCKELVAYAQRFIADNKKVINIIFRNSHVIALLTTVLTFIIILILAYVQLKFLLSPLAELLNGIKLIWAGDTEHRINITTHDEIGELAKVFNYMSGSIQREQRRLVEKATTDEMTGIFNFRYFQDAIEKEFEKASRFNHNLSFIIMDVDFFKHYNDTNGHQAGDQVLKTIAGVLKNSCRDRDIPARYGGEEFVVVLPGTPLEPAVKVAERIRKAVEDTPMIYQENQPNKNLTISIGVSNYPLNASTVKDLIELGDQALYEAKTSGKNKVIVAKTKKTSS
jgi:diguanylate cyclase (GGDEF)-like protein